MTRPAVLIFHRPASIGDPELVRLLADTRAQLAHRQARLFERAGAAPARLIDEWHVGLTFGEVLASVAPARGGAVIFGSGAVPRLNSADARQLVGVAASRTRHAITNNRYSSDIVAMGRAAILRELPPLPSDNPLPRWLEERAGFAVTELPGRERLALDLDTPLDVALAALAPGAPSWLRRLAAGAGLAVPRLEDLRGVVRDPTKELLVFGRSGSRTLAWLERNVRCRVRFLSEERGMRASSPLAIGGAHANVAPKPSSTLGLLLDQHGPAAFGDIVAELANAAIIDSRVLLAARLGADESLWPSAHDRFNSDLHRWAGISDPWLRALTASAADASLPILLGGHSLVGPGVRLLLAEGGLRKVGARGPSG
jgi:CTP:molybdopterin cytidylyltransferase MocA